MGDDSSSSADEVDVLGVRKGGSVADLRAVPHYYDSNNNIKKPEEEEGDFVVKLGASSASGIDGIGAGSSSSSTSIARILFLLLSLLRLEGKMALMRKNDRPRKKYSSISWFSSISGLVWSSGGNLGTVALVYIVVDYWRETGTWLSPLAADAIQTLLWTGLGAAVMVRAFHYENFTPEIVLIPRFLLSILFMVAALGIEAVFVHHVTATLGLAWHKSTAPLPDLGELILLWLNDRLPGSIVALLRAPLIGLHHFLMLFLMLAFSVVFGCIRPAGVGLGTRYMTAMGIGRLLRMLVFAGTIVPSPRPWCAETRFPYLPNHPQPFVREFYTAYMSSGTDGVWLGSGSPSTARYWRLVKMLETDSHIARDTWWQGQLYPPEYRPDWGVFQFLAYLLRPWDPSKMRGLGGHTSDWFSTLRRAGGGCNDLFYSGHVLVATLTAMAYQDAYPGWTSWMVWALLAHSGQREIRERHHYTADVVVGVFVGVALWRMTKRFGWCSEEEEDREDGAKARRERRESLLLRAAKDGDMGRVIDLLSEKDVTSAEGGGANGRRREKSSPSLEVKPWHHRAGVALVGGALMFAVIVFVCCSGG